MKRVGVSLKFISHKKTMSFEKSSHKQKLTLNKLQVPTPLLVVLLRGYKFLYNKKDKI